MKTKQELLDLINDYKSYKDSYGVIKSMLEEKVNYPVRIPKPFMPKDKTSTEMLKYAKELKVYEEAKDVYDAKRKEVIEYNGLIDQVIKDYIKDESGLDQLTKKQQDKVWNKAWSDAHSDGYHAVFMELEELIDLFN